MVATTTIPVFTTYQFLALVFMIGMAWEFGRRAALTWMRLCGCTVRKDCMVPEEHCPGDITGDKHSDGDIRITLSYPQQ